MKIVRIVTLTLLISWGIFTLGDCFEEAFSSELLLSLALLFLPFIVPVLYLVFKKKIHAPAIPGWVNTLTVVGLWIMENILLFMLIETLLEKDKWLVYQAKGGWENFLNGIEYLLFVFLNIAVPTVIVIVWNLIVLLYKKISEQSSAE